MISSVGETNGYIVIDDYTRSKYGRVNCIKIIEKETGSIVFQKLIPDSLEDGQIGTAGKTLVTRFEDAMLSVDTETWDFKKTKINNAPQRYAEWRFDETGTLRAIDPEGRSAALDPLSLAPAQRRTSWMPLTPSTTIPPRRAITAPLRVNTAMRSPLFGPDGTVVREDVGLVYPTIVGVTWADGQRIVVLVSSETIEQERWVLTGLDETGQLLWQIRQSDAAQRDRYFRKKDRFPTHLVLHQNDLLFTLQGRLLRVNARTGAWSVQRSYR